MFIKTRNTQFWMAIPDSVAIEMRGTICTITAIDSSLQALYSISHLLEIDTSFIGYISTSYVIYKNRSEKLTYAYDNKGIPKNKFADYGEAYNQLITVVETTTKILKRGMMVEVPKYTFTLTGENTIELQIKL